MTSRSTRRGRRSTSSTHDMQAKGKQILEQVEKENRVAVLMICAPVSLRTRASTTACSRSSRSLGYPIIVDALDSEGYPRVARPASSRTT